MASLYELNDNFAQVQEMIENGQEGLQDTLESIELAIEDKLENIAKVIQNLNGEVTALKAEEKRLSDKRRSIENNIKNLRKYAENALIVTGKDKIKSGLFTFSLQKSAPSLKVIDEKLIPKKYYVAVEPRLDKNTIKEYLKNGESVPGAELVQGRSLRIK